MKIAAILPMKGNSERIKNKNLKDFNGRPLYSWILSNLLSSKYIDVILINTDSQEIKESVKKLFSDSMDKIILIDRDKKNIGDAVPMNRIIEEVIKDNKFDYYIQVHSTSPLLSKKTIDGVIENYLNEKNYDSAMGVTPIYSRCYKKNGDPINHDLNKMLRTQDLEPIYEENSTFFIFSEKSFLESKNRISTRCKMYEINKIESIDIDTEEEFFIAKSVHKELIKKMKY